MKHKFYAVSTLARVRSRDDIDGAMEVALKPLFYSMYLGMASKGTNLLGPNREVEFIRKLPITFELDIEIEGYDAKLTLEASAEGEWIERE